MLLQNLHKIILGSTILQKHSVEDDDTGFKIVDNVRIDEYFLLILLVISPHAIALFLITLIVRTCVTILQFE